MRRFLTTLAASLPAVLLALTALCASADPRPADALNAGELRTALRRLQVTGSLLYVGAHPDDDNTSLLAYLARGRMVRSAYLSLTRGDGGQNILGPETGNALGVLRTQELLASRRVDGAEQFFTRALDYGFSKSGDEALAFWGHDRTLADIVWIIRRFRPDVIVSRFGTDASGSGHGHHTASAILAGEAFRAAADSTRFPEQLRFVTTWQAKRLVWNSWMTSQDPKAPMPVTLDAGAYDPELGLSYSELGGRARSLNRSQGAGTRERRGAVIETFQHLDGEPAVNDLFDGVTLDWSRIAGGPALAALLREAEAGCDPDRPWEILPALARAHRALATMQDDPLVRVKRSELENVMRSCAGLWIDALAETPTATPGDTLRVTVTAIARTPASLSLTRVTLPLGARAFHALPAPPAAPAGPGAAPPRPQADNSAPADSVARALVAQRPVVAIASVVLPADLPFTQPFWLRERPLAGSFEIADPLLVAEPEAAPALVARVTVDFAGEPVTFDLPVAFKWTDRVYGDRYRAVEVLPPVTCQFDQSAYLFAEPRPREVRLAVQSTRAALSGVARLLLPAGWSAVPAEVPVTLEAGAEQVVRFRVTAGPGPAAAVLGGEVEVQDRRYASSLSRIDYPHVPIQALLTPCEARLVRTELLKRGQWIAYLMGPGDQGPDALRQMGFDVTLLDDDAVESTDLSRFDCIVTGVRAYNTRPRLRVLQPRLLDYVKNGGRLVVQYCTNDDALNDRLGPWPLRISRDRVAVEDAEMRFLKPAHPLLRTPNAITARDFEGWVQERGLNYATPWDPRYEAVLSANDPGEPARDGGLLCANYGKGVFVYSGLALFRQLPAGVPGAWRLFANLASAPR
jgi:LmbE family N-acetylglucosaminyl deacetylase